MYIEKNMYIEKERDKSKELLYFNREYAIPNLYVPDFQISLRDCLKMFNNRFNNNVF